jgi:hypothetical protein
MSSSRSKPAAGSELRPSEYPIPPLAAIFLTHFHDTKGQTVVYYISNNETSTSFLLPSRIREYQQVAVRERGANNRIGKREYRTYNPAIRFTSHLRRFLWIQTWDLSPI